MKPVLIFSSQDRGEKNDHIPQQSVSLKDKLVAALFGLAPLSTMVILYSFQCLRTWSVIAEDVNMANFEKYFTRYCVDTPEVWWDS